MAPFLSTLAYASRAPPTPPPLTARNAVQKRYMQLLQAADPPIVLATGPAGCAKTFLCTSIGMRRLLDGGVKRLVITRPAVPADGEEHGFLPGTLEEKMDPWLRPIYDVMYRYATPAHVTALIARRAIEVCPLAFMRGRTFDSCWIIADEMQNASPKQMLMLMTRIGRDSKLVITGDPQQHDRAGADCGLTDVLHRMAVAPSPAEGIEAVRFTAAHVERHPVVREVLNLYT